MLSKESWIYVTDNTNVRWIKIFQLYKGSYRRCTYVSLFIKGSARVVEPPRIEYKGFKYKYKIKGDIIKNWICRSRINNYTLDRRSVKFNDNAGVNINKKHNILSKYLNGCIPKSINRKKLITLFKIVV